jgi:aubergine-like protein
MSVASNIMKQINSKIGGESVRVKLPEFMTSNKVMIVGIDVCHQGKNSIVGFSASTNRYCTSFYSDVIIQAKNQEIVKKDLDRCLIKALAEFKNIE